jgi:NADPH-dependent curcumin reductase
LPENATFDGAPVAEPHSGSLEAFEPPGRWLRDGSPVHKEDIAYGLENAPKALLRLFSGENLGKQLVSGATASRLASGRRR